MAHFAQLDDAGVVLQVVVVHNNELLDDAGQENEARGVAFCQSLFGADTRWVQTSYNGTFRKNYAGIGFTFDPQRDAFIPIQPFPSWVLDTASCTWQPPVPYPQDGKQYSWDELTATWIALQE